MGETLAREMAQALRDLLAEIEAGIKTERQQGVALAGKAMPRPGLGHPWRRSW